MQRDVIFPVKVADPQLLLLQMYAFAWLFRWIRRALPQPNNQQRLGLLVLVHEFSVFGHQLHVNGGQDAP